MPNVSISIGGQVAIVPGVYVQNFIAPEVPSGNLNTGPLLFIAASYGGIPFKPYNFTDANSLMTFMRGAPSQDFVPFMFNPSSEVNGTSLVTLINVAPNTQSSATMQSSGGTNIINLTSSNYGTPSNSIQYSVGAGSTAGVSMSITDGFSNTTYTGTNLGIPFQLAYLGSSSLVTYTISSTIAGQATSLVISSPVMGESIQLDLTSPTYATVSQVVQELNGTGVYSCTVLGNGSLPSSSLDLIVANPLPAPIASVPVFVNVTATLGDVIFFVNTFASSIATAALFPSVVSTPALIPALVANQFFTGATNQVPSLADYASGLNVGLTQPAWAVHIDSNTAGVRALGAQHAATACSTINRSWRRYVTGSVIAETPSVAQTNARQTNELMVTYCWPGIQATSTLTALNQTYDGNHVAAAVAGIYTGNPASLPVTNKTLVGNGVEQQTDLATMNSLQSNGVLVLNLDQNTRLPTFLSDVTTWQNDSNPANVFNQQVSLRFALNYYLVNSLQPYVGGVASNFSEAQLRNAAARALNQVLYNGQNTIGLLNSWDPNSLTVTYDGTTQTSTVAVAVVLVGQNRFIVVNVTINPLNIQISSQGVITNG